MYSFNTLRLYLWETIVFFRYAIFTDHIALMEMGERSMEADSVRDPLIRGEEGAVYRGNRVLPSPAPSLHPPSNRPQGVWLVRGGLRQWPPWQLFLAICLSFCLLHSLPHHSPPNPLHIDSHSAEDFKGKL